MFKNAEIKIQKNRCMSMVFCSLFFAQIDLLKLQILIDKMQ